MIFQNLKEKEHICNAYEYQLNRIKTGGNLRYGRKKVYVIY